MTSLASMFTQCPGDDFELICGVMAPQDTLILTVDEGIFQVLEKRERQPCPTKMKSISATSSAST